jgi:hypothetical protein
MGVTAKTGNIGTTTAAAAPSGPKQVALSEQAKADLLDPAADFSTGDCAVNCFPDGSAEVLVSVPAEIMKRLRSRALNQNLAEYIAANITRRAFLSYVY